VVVPVGDGWVPEFPGQRPPFAPGNQLGVRHGAFSEARVLPLAGRILAAMLADEDCPPYLHQSKFTRALQAWSRAEAQAEVIQSYLDSMTVDEALSEVTEGTEGEDRLSAPGSVKRTLHQRKRLSALDALHRAESRAQSLRRELGLSPSSYAALARDVSLIGRQMDDGLERMGTEGHKLVAAQAVTRAGRDAELAAVTETANPHPV
jgi:hypothetical protein